MNLKDYIEKGVQELRVQNGQAVAVNPYKFDVAEEGAKFSEVFYLKALPCAESVKEGTYPIDRFEEVWQAYYNAKWWSMPYEHAKLHSVHELNLVLSEPIVETEDARLNKFIGAAGEPDCLKCGGKGYVFVKTTMPDISGRRVCECRDDVAETKRELLKKNLRKQHKGNDEKFFDIWFDKNYPSNEVAEKPEGESQPFDDYFIGKITLDEYNAIMHKLLIAPPEAQPVASAEEILNSVKEQYAKDNRCSTWNMFLEYHGVRESTLDDIAKECASLRVAQEKAELIEKLEEHIAPITGIDDVADYVSGIDKAIELVKKS